MTLTIALKLRNETKGTVRYEEVGWKDNADYALGTLYIRKNALNKPYPNAITVKIDDGQKEGA